METLSFINLLQTFFSKVKFNKKLEIQNMKIRNTLMENYGFPTSHNCKCKNLRHIDIEIKCVSKEPFL